MPMSNSTFAIVFGNGRALADALHHRGAPCLHSSVCKRFAGLHPEGEEDSSMPSEGLFRNLCPSIILTQGDSLHPLYCASKVLMYSWLRDSQLMRNFSLGFSIKVQFKYLTGSFMISLIGLRMLVIVIEQLLQALFIIIADCALGSKLLKVVIDMSVENFDVLALVDDFESGKLDIAEMDTIDFSLSATLDEGVVLIEECLAEVLYRDVLQVLAEGETGVLEHIIVIDVLFCQSLFEVFLICCIQLFELL